MTVVDTSVIIDYQARQEFGRSLWKGSSTS